MSIFGFPAETTGTDIVPIVKYDARAGRLFRMDRVNTGNGFATDPVDITGTFKGLCDFENIEVGWFNFTPGVAPSIIVVKRGAMLPPKPSEQHKYGLQFMLKLAKECGGEEPIRKISGTSKAFRNAFEHIVGVWDSEHKAQGAKLPVLMFDGQPMPVTTGGVHQSTNYHPRFKIVGWAPRGDLAYVPQPQSVPAVQPVAAVQPVQGNGAARAAAPATGAQRAPAPAPQQAQAADFSSDFG